MARGCCFPERVLIYGPISGCCRLVAEYDIVGGGITILDSRTRDEMGNQVVTFTSGHIVFRQSLLVRVPKMGRAGRVTMI